MSAYLISPKELRRFKFEYPKLTRSNAGGSRFFVKAWVSKTRDDRRTLEVIVAAERPAVVISAIADIPLEKREPEADEHEPESRKDTLWGDLKLLAKKSVREAKHRLDHLAEVKSKLAPVNLLIQMEDETLVEKVQAGEVYYFSIVPKNKLMTSQFDFFASEVMSDAILPDLPPLSGSFTDYLERRFRVAAMKVAALLLVIIPTCSYIHKNTSEPAVSARDPEAASQQLANLEASYAEKRGEALLSKFKKEVEARTDIGLLVEGAVVGSGDSLTLWARRDWKKVAYELRLEGMRRICALWASTLGQNVEAANVQLLQEGRIRSIREIKASGKAHIAVGGCEKGGGAWVEE